MRKIQDKINDIKKTISKAKINHLWNFNTSGAMYANSRNKLIVFSHNKSVLNGFCWYL